MNKDLKLDVAELRDAEASLNAAFPHIDVALLEEKASSGGVTLADLEPMLLAGLGTTPRLTFNDGSGRGLNPFRSSRPALLSFGSKKLSPSSPT